jgi:hypothetical protein
VTKYIEVQGKIIKDFVRRDSYSAINEHKKAVLCAKSQTTGTRETHIDLDSTLEVGRPRYKNVTIYLFLFVFAPRFSTNQQSLSALVITTANLGRQAVVICLGSYRTELYFKNVVQISVSL